MSGGGITAGDLATILGIFAGVVGGFIALAKIMLGMASKEREADRRERKELSDAIVRMAKSSDKVAAATERGADEAKQRNGHLAELIVESTKTTQALAEGGIQTIVEAFQKVDTQKVEHQIVTHVESADEKK